MMPHTVFTCLYAHPLTVQTMRVMTGRAPYSPSIGPDFRIGEAPSVVADLEPRPSAPVTAVDLPPLAVGSLQHALVSSLLAYVTGGLKSLDYGCRAIFTSDIHSEEDFGSLLFGADLAWNVSAEETMQMLADAERGLLALLPHDSACSSLKSLKEALAPAALVSADDKAASPPVATRAAGWLHEALDFSIVSCSATPPGDPPLASPSAHGTASSSGINEEAIASLIAHLRLRRVQLALQVLMSYSGGRAAAAAPLRWGSTYDLTSVSLACKAAVCLISFIEGTSSLFKPAASSDNSNSISDEACAVSPEYAKWLLSGHFRLVHHPAVTDVPRLLRQQFLNVQALTQLPALASHNPQRPYWPSDVYPQTPGLQEQPYLASDSSSHPSVTRVTAGAFIAGTVPLKTAAAAAAAFHSAAAAVTSGSAASAAGSASGGPKAAALAADPASHQSVLSVMSSPLPHSGIVDPPLDWPMTSDSSINSNSNSSIGSRPHVSLMALLRSIELLSRRSPDALVRSWMVAILIELPSRYPAPSSSTSSATPDLTITGKSIEQAQFAVDSSGSSGGAATAAPPIVDEYADWATAHERSAVVLGSHTMQELIRVHLLDSGVAAEFVASLDGRRFIYMLDRVFQNLVLLLARNRGRIRRLMDAQFRDWSIVAGECTYLDDALARYLHARTQEADEAFIKSGGVHPAASSSATGPAISVTASGSPTSAVTAEEHRHLHVLRTVVPVQPFLSAWAGGIIRWLQQLHTVIGVEAGLYHHDEQIALYWHLEVFTSAAKRRSELQDGIRGLLTAIPELRTLTSYARHKLASGEAFSIELGVPSSGDIDLSADGAEAATAQGVKDEEELPSLLKGGVSGGKASSGGGKGKKGSGASGKSGSGGKETAISTKQLEAAQAKLTSLVSGWAGPVLRDTVRHCLTQATNGDPSSGRPPSRCAVLWDAHHHLCSGLMRVLMGASLFGLYRGLTLHVPPSFKETVRSLPKERSISTLPDIELLLYAPPHEDATVSCPPASIRCDGRTYDQRWRDVNLVQEAPTPAWWRYVDSVCHLPVSRAHALQWLKQAADHLKGAQSELVPVTSWAKAALAGDAAALGLKPVQLAAATAPAVAAAVKPEASGAGKKEKDSKGKGKKAAGKGPTGGDKDSDDADGLLLSAASTATLALSAATAPSAPLPSGLSSWDVLTAGYDAAEAQRLARVCVANNVLVTQLSTDKEALAALPPDAPPSSAAGYSASASGLTLSMLDPDVVTWRGRWAERGVRGVELSAAYDALYPALRLAKK